MDTNTLKSYGIQSGNVIHLVLAVSFFGFGFGLVASQKEKMEGLIDVLGPVFVFVFVFSRSSNSFEVDGRRERKIAF